MAWWGDLMHRIPYGFPHLRNRDDDLLMRTLLAVGVLAFSFSCWGELNPPITITIPTPAKAASHQQTGAKNPQDNGVPEKSVAKNNIAVPQTVVAPNHQVEGAKSTE